MALSSSALEITNDGDSERVYGRADLSGWRWLFSSTRNRQEEMWRLKAKCLSHGDAAKSFVASYTDKASRADTNAAKRVCWGEDGGPVCPVRQACLEYALANKIDEGVWGGVSATARGKLGSVPVSLLPTNGSKTPSQRRIRSSVRSVAISSRR